MLPFGSFLLAVRGGGYFRTDEEDYIFPTVATMVGIGVETREDFFLK